MNAPPTDRPKTTQELLREYAQTMHFNKDTFKRVRYLMRMAADELDAYATIPMASDKVAEYQASRLEEPK